MQLGGDNLASATLTFTDPSGTAFENGGAVDLFSSGQFTFVPLCVTGIGCAFNPSYSGPLTSFSSAPLPEASTLLLLLSGIALGIRRIKR